MSLNNYFNILTIHACTSGLLIVVLVVTGLFFCILVHDCRCCLAIYARQKYTLIRNLEHGKGELVKPGTENKETRIVKWNMRCDAV